MFKYSKGNNRTLIYSFPPRKSFPLLGSSLLLARFPLSPGSFAQGNTAVFSYSSLLDPACYKGSARGQGATEGSKQMATARVEWIKGWKPPRCFWSHPTHQDLPEMPQGGWGALGSELIPHYMVQLLCLTLQSFRCPGSTRPPPFTEGTFISSITKANKAIWTPFSQGSHILFTSYSDFRHWQKQFT